MQPDWFLLYVIIIGIVAGALARWILPGEQPMNIFMTMLLGIVGAVLGHFAAGTWLTKASPTWQFFFAAIVGAFVLLTIVEVIRKLMRSKST